MSRWIDNWLGLVAFAAAVGVMAFVIGVSYGREHPGRDKVVVPAWRGVPDDLPLWACDEIVRLRLENLNLSEALKRARIPRVWHYTSSGEVCR